MLGREALKAPVELILDSDCAVGIWNRLIVVHVRPDLDDPSPPLS